MNYRLPVARMEAAMRGGGIREIMNRAGALERAGKKIVHLEVGRPDYDSPACAKEAVKKALDAGLVHYTDTAGIASLRRALSKALKRDQSLDIDPDREILVTVGACEALAVTFFTFLEPGDEVIVPTPFFPAYADQIALAEGVLREVPCRFENEFRLAASDIEKAITPKTRLLLINTPNNPTGAVLRKNDLEEIAELARKHDLLVVSDECYEKFLYEGEHVSILSLPEMRERTILISAASKTFSMTGWRVGWIVLPPEVRPYAAKNHQNLTSCATAFAQAGVAEALENAGEDVKRMIEGYRERRDALIGRLRGIDGFETHMPGGAFYAFPRVEKLLTRFRMTTAELAGWLLEEAGVATVPGEAFHAEGAFLRMAYCRPLEEIHEAMDRVENAVRARLRSSAS
ncbi:MAG: pyridoxal phosphate-dependent aminotransferase [Synergistaceae bacterium]|jgi:aspartate aminotransferase/aminotransferase|nr:pyridoxal phosphate-dependent aminotransferase [Synergistaceae bacterium]